jgi:ubiquinone biosynthesis protein UbiJ
MAEVGVDDDREALRRVEEDLARLRRDVAEARQQIGERWDAPTDAAELAMVLTNVEQQEALIEDLEARRETLLRRLGED